MQNQYTFTEIYEKTFVEFIKDKSESSKKTYEANYKSCQDLHGLIFREIEAIQLQKCN